MGHRDEATFVDAVRSVRDQVGGRPVEVVAVTSGGDGSAGRLRSAFPDLTIVERAERLLPGATRNAGIAATSGEVVAFLAADCVARPGWVEARLDAHRAGHGAVATPVDLLGPTRPPALAGHLLLYATRLPGRPPGPVPAPIAHGLSVRRALLDELGGFDEAVRIGEDTDLAARLERAGHPLVFAPGAVTAHPGPASLPALLRDQWARGGRRAAHGAPPTALLRPSARQLRDRLRVVVTDGWRHRAWPRRQVLAAAPAVLLGAIANQAGWLRTARTRTRR
jgi:GT2 family glycosyltransferase